LYLYSIGGYNNSNIVRRVMEGRGWWADIADHGTSSQTANFYWRTIFEVPYSLFNGQDGQTRLINRFEGFYEVHEKDNLLRNLWFYCRRNNIDLFEIVPVSFSFRLSEAKFYDDLQAFARVFRSLNRVRNNTEGGYSLAKYSNRIEEVQTEMVPDTKSIMLSISLQPTSTLVKPMRIYNDKYNQNHDVYFDFTELGILDRRLTKKPLKNSFANVPLEQIKIPSSFYTGKNIWIIKPTSMSRGRGIQLFNSLFHLQQILKEWLPSKNQVQTAPPDQKDERVLLPPVSKTLTKVNSNSNQFNNSNIATFVIQKYIESPMLYKEYKFDIRIYACITHDMRVLLCTEGYCRLSSYKYTFKSRDPLVHLTNNALQVGSQQYGTVAAGNIIGLRQVEQEIGKDLGVKVPGPTFNHEPWTTARPWLSQIATLTYHLFSATFDLLNRNNRKYCMQMFGLDFMVDSLQKVYLIEANAGPSLEESCPYLSQLLTRALSDLFSCTLDVLFKPPPGSKPKEVEGSLQWNGNMWVCLAKLA